MKRISGLMGTAGLVAVMLAIFGCDEWRWNDGTTGGKDDYGTVKGQISIDDPGSIVGPISIAVTWFAAQELDEYSGDVDYPGEIDDEEDWCTDSNADDTQDVADATDVIAAEDGDLTDEVAEETYCPNIYMPDFEDFETCDGSMGEYATDTCRTEVSENASSKSIEVTPESSVSFELKLKKRPPKSSRVDLAAIGGEGWYAEGVVIGFTDSDGDKTFDASTPDEIKDTLLFTSYYETEDTYYLAWVVYLAGTFPDDDMMADWFDVPLQQGFNVIVEDYEGTRRLDDDEAVTLFSVDTTANADMAYLACSEIEYRSEMNVPLPEEGITGCMAMGTGWEGEDGEMEMMTVAQWIKETPDTENICVIDQQSAAICVTEESQYPESWEAVCGDIFW